MPAPTMRASFPILYDSRSAYLKEIIMNGYGRYDDEYSEVLNVKTTDRMKEVDVLFKGNGLFSTKLEGDDMAMDSFEQSYQKEFTVGTWAKAMDVTMEAKQFDQNSIMNDMAMDLGISAHETVEQEAFNRTLNGGFTTETAADGVAIFGTHTTYSGATITNSFATALDEAGLDQAIKSLTDLVDESNRKIRVRPYNLVVSQSLWPTAVRLLESTQRVGTSDNDTNHLTRYGIKPVLCHYLSSTTSWFLTCDPAMLKAKFYWVRRPYTVDGSDFLSQDTLIGMLMQFMVGVSDYRGLVGSTG